MFFNSNRLIGKARGAAVKIKIQTNLNDREIFVGNKEILLSKTL
jgi:hypothetical protein